MAEEDKAKTLRARAKYMAMEGLRPQQSFPVSPLRAMWRERRVSKRLAYPLPPYPIANIFNLALWSRTEWKNLGHWQKLALPVIALVALTTWEKERILRDAYEHRLEKAQTRREVVDLYVSLSKERRKGKFLGIIPLGR